MGVKQSYLKMFSINYMQIMNKKRAFSLRISFKKI